MVSNASLTDPANAAIGQSAEPQAEDANATHPVGASRSFALVALVLYQLVAIVFFGRPLLGHFSSLHAGQSSDPGLYIWFLEWWLYAISHHLNPFLSRIVWAPEGFNVAWSTSMPLLSLLVAPITLSRGPIVAFNLLALLLPSLTAWSGFLLIQRIVKKDGPALLGGYLFGFSPVMAANQTAAHIFFTAAFLIPAAIYLVLERLEEKLPAARFGALLAATLLGQFLISIEVFATMILFGAVALGLASILWPERRRSFKSIAVISCMALAVATLLLSPYLFYMLRASGAGLHPIWSGAAQTDLLEFFVPTRVMMLGQLAVVRAIASHYLYDGYLWESGAYAGLPMLLLAAFFLKARWRYPSGKFLAILIVTIAVAMLGKHLRIDGHRSIKLPWLLLSKLPFLNNAVPARFAIYFHLLLAIMVATWMAESRRSATIKSLVASLLIITLLPNLDGSFWVRPLALPKFFSSGAVRQQLREHQTVLTLPYGSGASMIWQAINGMYFSMTGAWTGPIPRSFEAWPIVNALKHDVRLPNADQQLRAFLTAHGAQTVLIDANYPQADFWRSTLKAIGTQSQEIQGVIIARLPDGATKTPRLMTVNGNAP